MKNQAKWTEADFDQMSWHDCRIHSMAFDQEGESQSDLVLTLDFIVEWLCGPDKSCRFRIAPATLRFRDVDHLNVHFSLGFRDPLEISAVERVDISRQGCQNFHWTIEVRHCSEPKENCLEFDATGFVQELTGKVIESTSQHLTAEQRRPSHG